MRRIVPLPPNGVLGNYVPFYFAPRSPMLYTIDRGNTDYKGGQKPVVHLVSSTHAVVKANPGIAWMFTEGHAEIAFSKFFNELRDLDKIDWKVMGSKYWTDTLTDNDRKRRRQAEFLVHEFFPWDLINEIGVYDAGTAALVNEHLKAAKHKPTVTVRTNWYY